MISVPKCACHQDRLDWVEPHEEAVVQVAEGTVFVLLFSFYKDSIFLRFERIDLYMSSICVFFPKMLTFSPSHTSTFDYSIQIVSYCLHPSNQAPRIPSCVNSVVNAWPQITESDHILLSHFVARHFSLELFLLY